MECVVKERIGQFCDIETVSAEISNAVSNNGSNAERIIKHSYQKLTTGVIIKTGAQTNNGAPKTPTKSAQD